MAKGGPKGPSKPMTDEDFEKLVGMIRIQCTAEEICAILGMSEDTLGRRIAERNISGVKNFADLYKRHQDEGKASLRRAQWKAATQDNNPTMLVWLGKNMLGQTDKQDVRMSGEMAHKIQVQFIDDDDDEEEDD